MNNIINITEEALTQLHKEGRRDLARFIETASPIEEVFSGCKSVADVIAVCEDLKAFEEGEE